jgi:O-antigen/teichoic acid export membrane protein
MQRILAAGAWVFTLRVLDKLVRLVRITILARLLAPADFGQFGIALLALSLIESISQTGYREALIQQEEEVTGFLDTAWTLQVLRGLLIAAVLFYTAPLVARFFNEPLAAPLLAALSLNALLIGLTSTGIVTFERSLRFGRHFTYMFSGTMADLAVALPAAFILRSAWALVLGMLAGSLVRMILSHLLSPPVRFGYDRGKARLLTRFGRWIWATRIANFLLAEGDDVFVGKILGTGPLGIYRLAYLYGNLPATEITHVISSVTFPAYARIQSDRQKVREGFLRTLRLTMFLATPFAMGIIILTPDFVVALLSTAEGNDWLPMILPMQILAGWGYLRSITSTGGAVLQGVGRPELITRLVYLKLVILAALIWPLTARWGLPGTAAAVVAASLLVNPVSSYLAIRVTGCGGRPYLAALAPPLAASFLMGGAMLGLRPALLTIAGIPRLLLLGMAGTVVYLAAIWMFARFFNFDIRRDLR